MDSLTIKKISNGFVLIYDLPAVEEVSYCEEDIEFFCSDIATLTAKIAELLATKSEETQAQDSE